ncbi:MAG: ATP-dependent chaperone ClpB, partial [Sphingomonadales bacterium]
AAEATEGAMLRKKVSPDDIAAVVARWTGIPMERMLEGERDKLLQMEDQLGKRVIGQADAVKAVAKAVRRSRAGLQDPNRPLGSFLFLGPTGVGKTELTKALAEFLFDEVEKAHPDVFNVLLQVLDDGRLTDGQGRTVDFSNTIIILTSNLGSQYLATLGDDETTASVEPQVMELVKAHFKPEFLNRLDEIILFHRLAAAHMAPIVDIQVGRLAKLLADRKIIIELSDAARAWLGRVGYDPVYGARPLKRAVQRYLQDPLADMILRGEVRDGSSVKVDEGDGALKLDVV